MSSTKKKKTRKNSSSRRHEAVDEWQEFTSPDGHPYYYNALTKESRWELPAEQPAPTRGKHRRPKSQKKLIQEEEEPQEKEKKKNEVDETIKNKNKPRNAMFEKLQASLEGKLNGPMLGMRGPPPMLNIRREEEVENSVATEEPKSLEEQYENETAGMSAAERLRFLRKKRQENMMAKRESIAADDFMAEVANNMKKKGVSVKEKKSRESEKRPSWKEKEQAEEERKRLKIQEEMEAKEQEEARKKAAEEREKRREQEREEQLAIEQKREQERKQRQEEMRKEKEEKQEEHQAEVDIDQGSTVDDVNTPSSSNGVNGTAKSMEDSDVSSPEREKQRRRSRSHGSRDGSVVLSETEKAVEQEESVENGQKVAIEPVVDSLQNEKEERRARKKREKKLMTDQPTSVASEPPRRQSVSSSNELHEEPRPRSSSSLETEEEARARQKQLRREQRRMAKMEAALAAQSLETNGSQGIPSAKQPEHSNGSAQAGNYPMNGQPQPQPGQPPLSGGMYPSYPYMMMPPPPPSPYGYYYPYMQPPMPMPMPMYPPGMVPPGYQMIPPTPPPSADGMTAPSALVPYGADSTLANMYGMDFGGMYGQQQAPELSRCDCCKGVGVGLVEKNGVCAHCNRLRLAFIVDSAQMRQRCSVCKGWGFQLLQANGMCEHCTRQTARKSTESAVRRRSVAASTTAARGKSTGNPSKKNEDLDDVDWDKSSDDSDWDE